MTVDLNFGVINQGREKNHEPKTAIRVTIKSDFRHLYIKRTKPEESNSSLLLVAFIIKDLLHFSPKLEIFNKIANPQQGSSQLLILTEYSQDGFYTQKS